ncbi:MAG: hypothetical protein R2880_19285 [Deinococcales bacterium]
MVTEPEIRSPEEARDFLNKVRAIAQALGVSDANPEEGKLRADVNVSVREPGAPFGTKVEIKNLNSFKAVQHALEFEIKRQSRLLEDGGKVRQETRGWDDGGQKTYLMRIKEGEADYRYMPDPDLPPMRIDENWLMRVRLSYPELPDAKFERYAKRFKGMMPTSPLITALSQFFDAALASYQGKAQNLANWLNSDVVGLLNQQNLAFKTLALRPEDLIALKHGR